MTNSKDRIQRKLAAIIAADVAGYSRLMSTDEAGTMQTLCAYRRLMDDLIMQHGGRIVNTAGDSVLAEFASIFDAVECSVNVQIKLGEAAAGLTEDAALRFRMGVHLGDVIIRGTDLLGDGVNIAARLEGMADRRQNRPLIPISRNPILEEHREANRGLCHRTQQGGSPAARSYFFISEISATDPILPIRRWCSIGLCLGRQRASAG